MSAATERQRVQWTSAAAAWERRADWLERNLRELCVWFCEVTQLAPGDRVLDVACGAGQPALALARAGGRVVATDISRAMIEAASRRARAANIDNLELREMDAEHLDFTPSTFAAATCSFGLMFCPDPRRALAEMHRVLEPGGRLAITAWDVPANNPFFTSIAKPLESYQPPTLPVPEVFRLSPPGRLAELLRDAGFENVTVDSRPMIFDFASLDEYWEIQTELAAPLQAAVGRLTARDVERLKSSVFSAISCYLDDCRVRIPATALCATGQKP